MQDISDAGQVQKKTGTLKGIAILFVLPLIASLLIEITTGDGIGNYPGATGRYIGQVVGGALPTFILATIVFFMVRFMRKTSAPTTGLMSGIVVTLIVCGLAYLGARN